MAQVGRISGPLLTANLERNGIDLKFRNTLDVSPLLYLDTTNNRIGIATNTITEVDLQTVGTTRVTSLISDRSTIADFSLANNNINVSYGNFNLNATDAIVSSAIETQQFYLDDNYISTKDSNTNIDLRPWQEYELVDGDPYTAELLDGLTAASSGSSHPRRAFWEVNLPSGYQRGDLNESSSIDIDDVMGFLSVSRGLTTSGDTYDRSIAAIKASLPTLESFSDVNVDGNIHATGNITFAGDLTFGDTISEDTVTIDAEVDSNIIPDANNTYSLGQNGKRWQQLNTELVNGDIFTANITVGGLGYTNKAGNIFYVSVNGSDTFGGDSFLSPFKTIKHALSQLDSSTAGPVELVIFPGDYQEILPLEVPSNVTISGTDMRSVIITPTTSNQSEDVFLLNGESTVSNLTIKDFFYDSVNDKGYAFRFANNATVTSRSPYVQNVSVITQGSATSASDPRGFASADAGKGALVDGASVLSTSNDASMLFHSVTFITPGVDALTMTNGVRVEWLNSFTYFANRGLYAVNGTTGHLSTDGSTTEFGAEVRSIGSASVYGNYGAVADGADCLMYLIMHNFGYIGSGKFKDNDNSRAIQSQEVSELNNGKVRYQSTNHKGNFRVGDNFLVDFESGSTTLDISTSDTSSFAGLVIDSGSRTLIDGNVIEVSNFAIRDNTIRTIAGDIDINSATSETNITSNVSVSDNLDVTGNLSFDGNITVGDGVANDTINFNVEFEQNINPATTGIYSLGTTDAVWKKANLGTANIGDIEINENYITTDTSSADLDLRANGTGEILIASNNFEVTNDLTVNANTSLLTTTIVGDVTQTGNYSVSSNYDITGSLLIGQNLEVGFDGIFEGISIKGNVLTTDNTNENLELQANGTGTINVPFADTVIENNLNVTGTTYASDINNTQDVQAVTLQNETINITSNTISTILTNANLDITASPNGIISIPTSDVVASQDFTVNGTTTILDTNITGTLVHIGRRSHTGNVALTGNLTTDDLTLDRNIQLENIEITGNLLHTTETNSDLDLRANGTGRVLIKEDVHIQQDVEIGTLTAGVINITNDVDLNEIIIDGTIEFDDNIITTTDTDANLELEANGTGIISIPSNNVNILNATTVSGVTDIDDLVINGVVNHTGNINRVGNTTLTGNFTLDGQLTLDRGTSFEKIEIDYNVISTVDTNTDLELKAAGTGNVRFEDLQVNNNVNVGSLNDVQAINVQNTVALEIIELSTDVQLSDNTIKTTSTDSNLIISANGTGDVLFDNNLFFNDTTIGTKTGNLVFSLDTESVTLATSKAMILPNGTSAESIGTLAGLRFNTDTNLFEIQGSVGTINSGGVYSSDGLTGISVTNSDDIQIFVNGYTQDSTAKVADINGDRVNLHGLQVDDILFDNNQISTTTINSNLDIQTNGTGSITIDKFTVKGNTLSLSANETFEIKTTGPGFRWVEFEGTGAIKWPAGNTATRPSTPKIGTTRVNTDTNELETWIGDSWRTSAGEFASISEADMEEEAFVQTLIYG